LDKRKAVFRQVFIGHANACLEALFRVCKFLSLQLCQELATYAIQTTTYTFDNEFEWYTVRS
jgi:hypothetical protein